MTLDHERIERVLTPATGERRRRQEREVRARFFTTVRRAIRHIPFIEDVVASYYCAFDSRTPAHVRATILAALAYFVLPFDIVPDFIFGLGFTDDIAVLLAAFRAVRDHVRPEHYTRARAALGDLEEGDPVDS